MLDKLKSLFTNSTQKGDFMTQTQAQTQTKSRWRPELDEGVEQLSATSTSEDENTECSDNTLCQDLVRERAYLLWEQAGYPIGDGVDFWITAEQELSQ